MQNKKILIVEDDNVLRGALAEILKSNSYDVFECADGNDGLSVATNTKPNLILLDLNLPGMYGMTVMERIRKEADVWGSNVPIIILTNQNTDNAILEKIEIYHPSFYLIKSNISLPEVLDKVKICLQ